MAPHPGQGRLEAWSAVSGNWTLVCGDKWDSDFMSNRACRKLGYREANSTWIRDESRPNTRDRLGAQGPQLEAKNFFYKGRARGCQGSTQLAVYLGCKNFECGRPASDISGPSARIVGGTESIPGQWPWLVGLHGGVDEIFFCGGVLISPTWVLSAAHCVGNQTSITGWSVQLGLTRRTASPLFVRKRKLAAIIKHPAFNAVNSYGNDIALLKLDQPVDFDEFLRPVCLPKDGLKLSPGTRCTVVGWGKSIHAEDADYLNVAHEVEVPLVHHSVCSRWYSLQDVPIGDTMLCAGYPEGRKDACQGDSGGPLLCKDGPGEPWYVAGIVSWGINCAQPNLPGIYTNVGMYKEWIRAVSTAHGEAIFE
ncbi:Transmembrane protease serine 2 [Halotydeus destructor]|nr:Transmembrane protease serine 2 [Halotydeus destructor]